MAISNSNSLLLPNNERQQLLKARIRAIEAELNQIQQKTLAFETVLRTMLANELIEIQELTVLYKQQKKEKNLKRLAQKKRGKNYVEPIGLTVSLKSLKPEILLESAKEMKRLYREAMLQVHPDKFSIQEDQLELATEVTTKLIEIYKSGDLEQLKLYHSHIFSGNALEIVGAMVKTENIADDLYLKNELIKVEQQLQQAKEKYTYKVLTEYSDPMSFILELKEFYADKINKLKKRTRFK
ncbi:MAG: hypothetical protein COW03_02320 [Cytophagales bacterium CG12_big_fil_rev_8_21_14_0_65_40_12]|nr:MAG: hypothetical protein COW03_02320 [Cytophagales bacterium CG12_big_fil_rev_8_21_14_0_65_40_12]PIW02910.1 MAG: hypothetical protein COW40_17605 [Cytophagales bacterium CG17_big_fil_post_rev_8_21_14_2_50_40_13]